MLLFSLTVLTISSRRLHWNVGLDCERISFFLFCVGLCSRCPCTVGPDPQPPGFALSHSVDLVGEHETRGLRCSKLLLLSTHEITLGLCLHVLILPQGRHDDLPCSTNLVRGDEVGDDDSKQPHSPFVINQPGKHCAEDGLNLLCHLEALCAAGSSGHQLERAPADLERQRLPGDPPTPQAKR